DAGGGHTCAIATTGDAYCWGNGSSGQLGNGGNTNANTPVRVEAAPDMKFVAIDAGTFHTCAVATTGDAYCWGLGTEGQLGNGGNTNANTPTRVEANPGTKFIAIDAGGRHTCAIATTGDAYCWGLGTEGQLG